MLTSVEVEHIARLARLALSDDEKARFAVQLSAILDYAAELASVNVDDIAPTASVSPARSVMRDGDQVDGVLPRKAVLANAPASDGVSFVVQATFGDDA